MAKDFNKYQKGIVNRYYEHQETIRSERLSDLVAEIWLCEDSGKATKLWGRVQVALMKSGCNANRAAAIVGKRDTEALAKLVQELDAGKSGGLVSDTKSDAPGGSPADSTKPPIARGAQSVADGRTISQMQREKAAAGGYDSLDEGNLKRAMNAFKKKLKVTRRDDESRLGGRYVSSGKSSNITAITPPTQFPAAVWQELAKQGKLKPAGQGTYQLP